MFARNEGSGESVHLRNVTKLHFARLNVYLSCFSTETLITHDEQTENYSYIGACHNSHKGSKW